MSKNDFFKIFCSFVVDPPKESRLVRRDRVFDLKKNTNRKRRLYAWVLLLALFSQRLLGLVGSDLVYAVEIDAMMNPAEEAIAEKLQDDTGLDFNVEIRDKEQVDFLLRLGYSTPFLLSENIDGETQYYTLSHPQKNRIKVAQVPSGEPDTQIPPNPVRSGKDRLIADFFFWSSAFMVKQPSNAPIPGATLASCAEAPFIAIPSPPPQRA